MWVISRLAVLLLPSEKLGPLDLKTVAGFLPLEKLDFHLCCTELIRYCKILLKKLINQYWLLKADIIMKDDDRKEQVANLLAVITPQPLEINNKIFNFIRNWITNVQIRIIIQICN